MPGGRRRRSATRRTGRASPRSGCRRAAGGRRARAGHGGIDEAVQVAAGQHVLEHAVDDHRRRASGELGAQPRAGPGSGPPRGGRGRLRPAPRASPPSRSAPPRRRARRRDGRASRAGRSNHSRCRRAGRRGRRASAASRGGPRRWPPRGPRGSRPGSRSSRTPTGPRRRPGGGSRRTSTPRGGGCVVGPVTAAPAWRRRAVVIGRHLAARGHRDCLAEAVGERDLRLPAGRGPQRGRIADDQRGARRATAARRAAGGPGGRRLGQRRERCPRRPAPSRWRRRTGPSPRLVASSAMAAPASRTSR